MKKIALCFHDFIISKLSITHFTRAYLGVIKNVMYNNHFDLFIHVWEPTNESGLRNLKLKLIDDIFRLYKPEDYIIEDNNLSNANQQYWYSHNAVLELVNNYSNKNNI